MNLTDQCKDYFINWYKEFEPKSDWKYPAYDYFENYGLEYKLWVLTGFFDSVEIFIKIIPYLGGGQPVFYGSVCYRNKRNIDCEEELNPFQEEEFYTLDRTEITMCCIEKCNKVFNEINDPIVFKKEVEENIDDLPF